MDRQSLLKGIKMKRGDILLIQYRFDPIGWIIRYFTHCQWNHVAWFTNDKELIELKARGKRKTPLSHYLNKWLYKCKVVRLSLNKRKLEKALERAERTQFSYPYSSSIINFILIKLQITDDLPRLSCSGFIAYYLAQGASFYFNGKNTWFVTPKDIESSKKVKDVTNELLSINPSL